MGTRDGGPAGVVSAGKRVTTMLRSSPKRLITPCVMGPTRLSLPHATHSESCATAIAGDSQPSDVRFSTNAVGDDHAAPP